MKDKIKVELSKKIKIRSTISYPTMLNHYYVSQRDFEEFIQQIQSQETGLDMGSSKELRYTTNQSPDTQIQEEKKQ